MGKGVSRSASAEEIARRSRQFRNAGAFRTWLAKNHGRVSELLIRCFKVDAGGEGMTYREALDEALCFGWIDGVRRGLDGKSFSVRFTPRKPKSRWSTINIRRARELEQEGRMTPSGLDAFRGRVKSEYSFESRGKPLAPALLKEFRTHPRAWDYYRSQTPWYRKTSAFWVMSAKKEETRARRFAALISSSDRGEPIGPLKRPGK